MMHSSWPSSTVSPCLTSTFHMFPCRGEDRTSVPTRPVADAAPDFAAERLRRGFGAGAAPAGAAPFGAVPDASGGPTTRTSKRLPETSTE